MPRFEDTCNNQRAASPQKQTVDCCKSVVVVEVKKTNEMTMWLLRFTTTTRFEKLQDFIARGNLPSKIVVYDCMYLVQTRYVLRQALQM
jgi:hypothetical protein